MIINDVVYDADLLTIIGKLKADLADNGKLFFNKYFDSGDDVMVCCPYHKEGKERRPSAGIRKIDGTFHCLACGQTASLCEVISYCFGFNDPFGNYGYKWLAKNFLSISVENRRDANLDIQFTRNNCEVGTSNIQFISQSELDDYRYIHPYMYNRGLTDKIIERFDIGYDKQTDSITFPVRDINGNCMFVARRNVKYKHFDLPKGINKPLYGIYELSRTQFGGRGIPPLYVCEGLFDCLRLWCNGKYAVAGFGCLFSSYQIKQLQDLPFRTIILALDNDDAGRKATDILRQTLTNKLVYKAVIPSNKKDIGECDDAELENLEEILL